MRRPAVVLSTGAGKTVVFAHLAAEHLEKRGTRVLVLAHRDELVDQAISKIRQTAPHLHVGKVKAADNEVSADVVVASVQTVSRSSRLQQLMLSEIDYQVPPFGLIIHDECHHSLAASWRKVSDAFPDAVHAGFTATLARGDGYGLGSVWDDVVYSRPLLRMISDGYLTDVRGITLDLDGLNLRAVRQSGGDYSVGSLGEALETANGPELIAAAVDKHARDRRCVVFTPTVSVAHAVADRLSERGLPAAVVSAATPREERTDVYRRSRTGELHSIVNCQVLVEGFDAPWIDCVVVARPTRSAPLFIQMAGRGLRPFPGKTDCLLLDVAGTGGKLATLIDLAPEDVRQVQEGETLAEAAEREERRANELVPAASRRFSLRHRDMDLFAAASQNWLRTPGGVLFLAIGRSFVFLWARQDGTWDVGGAPPAGAWKRLKTGLPLGTAQAWAETFADERSSGGLFGPASTASDASWRRGAPSPQLLAAARSMGLPAQPGMTRGEVSDMVSVHNASRKFDTHLRSTT
jgi:superfamily II DNA or RNA helicase